MGLYDFKPRFVGPIERGEKTHTIRGIRDHDDIPGDTMHLYSGLRTKRAKLIFRAPCVAVESIEIRGGADPVSWNVRINGEELVRDECERLARRDGFGDFTEMIAFWDGRLPFKGHVFHWDYARRHRRKVKR